MMIHCAKYRLRLPHAATVAFVVFLVSVAQCADASALPLASVSDTGVQSTDTTGAAKAAANPVVEDFNAGLRDLRYVVRSVGNVSSTFMSSAALPIGVAVMTEAALVFGGGDVWMRDAMQRSQSTSAERIASIGNFYGTTFAGAAVGVSVYSVGLLAGSYSWRTAGRRVAETLVLAGVTTTFLKAVVGRARPYTNRGSMTASPFAFKEDYYAWPSGHTTVAFAVSSSLARSIDNVWVGSLLYLGAATTGAARMYYDKHWLSDVIAGAAIGTISSAIIHAAPDNASPSTSRLLVIPDAQGLSVSYTW